MPLFQERRRHERFPGADLVNARVRSQAVGVIDFSRAGARIEHEFPLPVGRPMTIELVHNNVEVKVECEAVRCKYERRNGRPVYCSGIRFVSEGELPTRRVIDRIMTGLLHRARHPRSD